MKWLFQRTAIILPGILNNSQDLTVYIPLSEQRIDINTVASRFLSSAARLMSTLDIEPQKWVFCPSLTHFCGACVKEVPGVFALFNCLHIPPKMIDLELRQKGR